MRVDKAPLTPSDTKATSQGSFPGIFFFLQRPSKNTGSHTRETWRGTAVNAGRNEGSGSKSVCIHLGRPRREAITGNKFL